MSTPDINPSNMHLVTHLLSDTLEVSFWKEPRIAAVMNTVRFICLTGVVFIFISEVSCLGLKNKCNCGPTSGGADVCGCQNVLIRPPLPHKLPVSNIHEISGSSRLKLEEEADYIHSEPSPKFSPSPYHRHESSYKFDREEVPYSHHIFYPKRRFPSKFETHAKSDINDYAEEEEDGYYYADNKLPVAPADAVSLSLAYEFAKRPGTLIKEEGLNFGPRTIPKDGAVIKARKDIPEDRLHGFDKQILEPRYPSAKYGLSHHDAASVEEEYEEESKYWGSGNYLSYADLGYVPNTPKKQHHFAVGPVNSYNDHGTPYEEKDEYLRPHPKPCHRRGHVRVRNHEIEDYIEEEGSQYNWEDREDGRHSRVKPEKIRKGHTTTNMFRPTSGYPKYV